MKPLRLGFVGGGLDSAVGHAHYSACRMDGLFEVVGGCFSRDWRGSRDAAEAYGCAAFLRDRDLLESDLDAVVVLTPTPVHFHNVDLALFLGVSVICEKALASAAELTANLIRARELRKGYLAVTYNYTGYPMVRELRDMIQHDDLGTIISIQAEMPQEGYRRDGANPQEWRKHDGAIPMIHLDLGTHLHHLIHFLTDEKPQGVCAQEHRSKRFEVCDGADALVEYQTFQATVQFSKYALGLRNGLRIRVNGTRAAVEWVQTNPEELSIALSSGHRGVMDRASPCIRVANQPRYQRFKAGHPAGFIEAYANLYYDLYHDLLAYKNGTPRPELAGMYSAEVAHEGLLMMRAMVDSAREGRWVTL